jgi:zinc protease
MFGEGISNKTSRLYRALVEGELAVSMHGSLHATIDPYLYNLNAILRPGRTLEELLAAMEQQLQRLQDEPPPAEELARAVKQARALYAYGAERITNQAFWLGFAEMFADYAWYLDFVERLSQVTPEDVQRVARLYLQPQNRVIGVYLPNDTPSTEAADE